MFIAVNGALRSSTTTPAAVDCSIYVSHSFQILCTYPHLPIHKFSSSSYFFVKTCTPPLAPFCPTAVAYFPWLPCCATTVAGVGNPGIARSDIKINYVTARSKNYR